MSLEIIFSRKHIVLSPNLSSEEVLRLQLRFVQISDE